MWEWRNENLMENPTAKDDYILVVFTKYRVTHLMSGRELLDVISVNIKSTEGILMFLSVGLPWQLLPYFHKQATARNNHWKN